MADCVLDFTDGLIINYEDDLNEYNADAPHVSKSQQVMIVMLKHLGYSCNRGWLSDLLEGVIEGSGGFK